MAQPRMPSFVCQYWEYWEGHSSGRVASLFWGFGDAASWGVPIPADFGGCSASCWDFPHFLSILWGAVG